MMLKLIARTMDSAIALCVYIDKFSHRIDCLVTIII